MADFITNDLALSESPSTGYSKQEVLFPLRNLHAAKLRFSTQCSPLARRNRSSPPISTPAWDIFPQPLATLRAPQLTNARPTKKNGALSRQMCPHSENTPQFFLPSRHHSFPLPPPRARVGARARTRTQRVFDFCLHRTTIRAQPAENKWIAREAFTLFHARYFEHNSLYHNLLR